MKFTASLTRDIGFPVRSGRPQSLHGRARESLPVLLLDDQLFLTSARQLVELRTLIVCRYVPLRFDPSTPLEPVQSWIQRSFLDLQLVAGDLGNALTDAVAVQRTREQCLQNQHVEGSLK